MKQKSLVSKAIFGVVTFLSAASIAAADGFSVGVSATRAPVGVQESDTSIDGEANGLRLFGSYMFNKNFGIEAGLSKYGSPNDKSLPSDMHVDTESYDVYAVIAYPVSDNMGFIGKVGFASWNTETEVNDTNEAHFKSTELALSVGGEYDISETFAVRGELEWFDSVASGELKYSLSGVIRFE